MHKNIADMLEIMGLFNDKYNVYKCEEKNEVIYFNILVSCVSEVLMSKIFFKKNKDVLEFLEQNFRIVLPEYVGKNRSLVLGRTIKHFCEIESADEVKDYLNILYKFLREVIKEREGKDKFSWQDAIDIIKIR